MVVGGHKKEILEEEGREVEKNEWGSRYWRRSGRKKRVSSWKWGGRKGRSGTREKEGKEGGGGKTGGRKADEARR